MKKEFALRTTPEQRRAVLDFTQQVRKAKGERILKIILIGSVARGDFGPTPTLTLWSWRRVWIPISNARCGTLARAPRWRTVLFSMSTSIPAPAGSKCNKKKTLSGEILNAMGLTSCSKRCPPEKRVLYRLQCAVYALSVLARVSLMYRANSSKSSRLCCR